MLEPPKDTDTHLNPFALRVGESECTYCPPNTKQCAHFDGHWVRLTIEEEDLPTVVWNFEPVMLRYFKRGTSTMFYHTSAPLADAEDDFHRLNAEMRKIARGTPGDDST